MFIPNTTINNYKKKYTYMLQYQLGDLFSKFNIMVGHPFHITS